LDASVNSGLFIGAEVGIADRFGNYRICCDTIVYSNRLTHSAELWGGVSLRHEGFTLFDTVRISPGVVFGLSAISNPIGQEGLHQVDHQGSARVLFYLGFEQLLWQIPQTPSWYSAFSTARAAMARWGDEGRQQRQRGGIRQRF
jgi:hypothetical protein